MKSDNIILHLSIENETVEQFNKRAIEQGKTYAQLQMEETVGFIREGKLEAHRRPTLEEKYKQWLSKQSYSYY